jgi:3-deoxy-D-manno-octulosonate 8-phosphate phosphatase (KDO 8-P phosphatase)
MIDLNFKQKLNNVKVLMFDVDGVFTDGSITLMENGDQIRTFNIKDGYAVQLAIKAGVKIAVITGARSNAVKQRLNYLGIEDVYLGIHDKLEKYEDYKASFGYTDGDILYMGDDLPDYEIMKRVTVPVCPSDAVHEIQNLSIYVSHIAGGKGCVRDVIEQYMRLKGIWMRE